MKIRTSSHVGTGGKGKRTKTREVGEEDCRINPITTGNKDPKYKLFNQSPAF